MESSYKGLLFVINAKAIFKITKYAHKICDPAHTASPFVQTDDESGKPNQVKPSLLITLFGWPYQARRISPSTCSSTGSGSVSGAATS
jgi:hypothetical protein